MPDIRFSIVIPTRNRAETLQYALRTCLSQNHGSFEIVVSDNCSSPETKKVIDSFGSDKIRYVRSDVPLAMSENWEFALTQAQGEYIVFIGDDDGLLAHALNDVDHLIEGLGSPLIRWERVYYSWPSHPKHPDLLRIPLNRKDAYLDSYQTMQRAANKLIDYRLLPMCYNSAIHCDLVGRLKQKTGRVFLTFAPDICSGFGFASLVKDYPSVGRPMSINGGSSASNGVATLVLKEKTPILQEYQTLNAQSKLTWHPEVPNILSLSAFLADAFLQVKALAFPNDSKLDIDRKRLVLNCLEESRPAFVNTEAREGILQAIRGSLSDDRELVNWFDTEIMNSELTQPESKSDHLKYGLTDQNLFLRADEFGVSNVYEASVLYEKLTGYAQHRAKWQPSEKRPLSYAQRIRKAIDVLITGN